MVHEKILKAKAPYFAGELDVLRQQPNDNSLRRQDIEVDQFHVIVNWVYNEKLPDRFTKPDDSGNVAWNEIDSIYKLADRLRIYGLQNALVGLLGTSLEATRRHYTLAKLKELYDQGFSGTSYYRCVLNSVVKALANGKDVGLNDRVDILSECSPQLTVEILRSLAIYNEKTWNQQDRRSPRTLRVDRKREKRARKRRLSKYQARGGG